MTVRYRTRPTLEAGTCRKPPSSRRSKRRPGGRPAEAQSPAGGPAIRGSRARAAEPGGRPHRSRTPPCCALSICSQCLSMDGRRLLITAACFLGNPCSIPPPPTHTPLPATRPRTACAGDAALCVLCPSRAKPLGLLLFLRKGPYGFPVNMFNFLTRAGREVCCVLNGELLF